MGSIKQIAVVLVGSFILIALIGVWIHKNNPSDNLLLTEVEELEGPLSPKELAISNPEVTNIMNRIAVMKTNKGDIEIELFEDVMPITTGNFIKLAEEKFYDGIKFHRVIPNFMVQAGDPNTKGDNTASYGTGGPGYTIQDEFIKNPLLTNVRGTIAMANTGQPNSGGSQFFINTVDNVTLDFGDDKAPQSNHPVFGRVIEGMDVVDAISWVETNASNLPEDPVIIESVTIESRQ